MKKFRIKLMPERPPLGRRDSVMSKEGASIAAMFGQTF